MHVRVSTDFVGGKIELLKPYMYFYQVQTQMHVTDLHWCDFCVWSPVEESFVQQIERLLMKYSLTYKYSI